MNVLWEDAPRSAREVLVVVEEETRWAYTTVKTMLTRLVTKGALKEDRRGNTALYTPRLSREGARQTALRSLVDRAFGGEALPLVQNLLDARELTSKDRERLRALLDKKPGGKGAS